MQGALSQLRSWKLDQGQEDIRGWALRDPEGHVLGTVGDVIVDTETKHVTQVVLGDGKRYFAHDILLGDHALVLERSRIAKTKLREGAAAAAAVAQTERKKTVVAKDAEVLKVEASSDVANLVVPIVEEELSIGKRSVAAGGVHLESHIVAEPFDKELRLREERVKVDRRRVDEPLSAAEADARLHDGSIEVKASSERAVVEKRAHVVEEIHLKKGSKERVEHVRDTLRHTEVEVTELSAAGAAKAKKGVKP